MMAVTVVRATHSAIGSLTIAPTNMTKPPKVARNPRQIKERPKTVAGASGLANMSTNAAMPTPEKIAPYILSVFTATF
jgi:hypothetical protein